MQKLFLFMSVTRVSARTDISILNAVAYSLQLESRSQVEVTLFIFDKSKHDMSSWAMLKEFGDRIRIVLRDPNETLMSSVAYFGSELCEDASWIQVLAEDDFLAFSDELIWHPDRHTSMAVPDMAFLGNDLRVDFSRPKPGPTPPWRKTDNAIWNGVQFVEGDSSWHALTRADVFRIYSGWLRSFRSPLHSFSSCASLLSAALGTVERLQGVLYVKEASLYDKPGVIADRTRENLILATGSESLEDSSAIFYLAAKLSLLEYGRNVAPNGNWDSVIKIVLADAMNHIGTAYLGRWDRIKYRIRPSKSRLQILLRTRIPMVYKELEKFFQYKHTSTYRD